MSTFHALLQSRSADVAATVERAAEERGLRFFGKAIARGLRPAFVPRDTYEAALASAEIVARAVGLATRKLWEDPSLRKLVGVSARDEAYVGVEPHPPREVFGRLDGFLGEDGALRYLEYNPMPAGIVFAHQLGEMFETLPVMAAFRETWDAAFVRTQDRVIPALEAAFLVHSGRPRGSIAIVAEPGATHHTMTESVFMARLAQQGGFTVQVVPPGALDITDEGVRVGGALVDCLVYDEIEAFVAAFPPSHALWGAVRSGKAWLLNSLVNRALRGNKGVFALLSDPTFADWFDAETRRVLAASIPWTRMARPGPTTDPSGAPVDLVTHAMAEQRNLVLKPADSYGGKGVVLGWDVDRETWARALRGAEDVPHVLQQRVVAPVEAYPFANEGDVGLVDCHVDFDPLIWNGSRADGAVVRIAENALLNVTAGAGSLVPFFLVAPKAAS